jgi:hypothetical protein
VALDFLSGGGAMGRLMREHDWSRTPIGDPEHWPQSLRTATSMCLNSSAIRQMQLSLVLAPDALICRTLEVSDGRAELLALTTPDA